MSRGEEKATQEETAQRTVVSAGALLVNRDFAKKYSKFLVTSAEGSYPMASAIKILRNYYDYSGFHPDRHYKDQVREVIEAHEAGNATEGDNINITKNGGDEGKTYYADVNSLVQAVMNKVDGAVDDSADKMPPLEIDNKGSSLGRRLGYLRTKFPADADVETKAPSLIDTDSG